MKNKGLKNKRVHRDYNLDNGVMTMSKNGKEYEFSFNGLPSNIFMKLAMIGAGNILCKHDKPMVQWEKINQNKFGRERNYEAVSRTVKALAVVDNTPIEAAIKKYKAMTGEERKAVKLNKDIRKQLLVMKLAELEGGTYVEL